MDLICYDITIQTFLYKSKYMNCKVYLHFIWRKRVENKDAQCTLNSRFLAFIRCFHNLWRHKAPLKFKEHMNYVLSDIYPWYWREQYKIDWQDWLVRLFGKNDVHLLGGYWYSNRTRMRYIVIRIYTYPNHLFQCVFIQNFNWKGLNIIR